MSTRLSTRRASAGGVLAASARRDAAVRVVGHVAHHGERLRARGGRAGGPTNAPVVVGDVVYFF